MTRRLTAPLLIVLVALVTVARAAAPLPARITDKDFWAVITASSELSGTFHSENLVSNEIKFQEMLPKLTALAVPGRAYVGVGSEQNFTYIAAVKPAVAVLVDLRRGNLDLHLLYKAFFEMSADRAEFVSRVFARPRPAGLTAQSSVDDIFAAFQKQAPSQALFDRNLAAAIDHLVKTHGFGITDGDREGMRYVYTAWFDGGPDLRYQLTQGGGGGGARMSGNRRGGGGPLGVPTYAELMTTSDGAGKQHSYLASEENFKFIKDLETRNLLIPIVGNFAGPKALKAAGAWLKQQQQTVSVFYMSNVEQYLRQDGIWNTFCANAATLPMDAKSQLVRSERGGSGFALAISALEPEFKACAVK